MASQLAPRFGVLILPNTPWQVMRERAQWYEALGLDTVWVADHFVDPWHPAGPWHECWTVLAGLAAHTSRVRLGPLVSHLVYRNPALLARQALTLDHLSGGRLDLGLGAAASGYDPPMTGGTWWPPGERVARFGEAVEIIDRLLEHGELTYDGEFYQISRATMTPGPLQRPRPPLTIAASGPRMVGLAARHADTWITEGAFPELSGGAATDRDVLRLAHMRAELLRERAVAAGRDADAVRRAFLFGFGPAPVNPWASIDAFQDNVGRYAAIGFDHFVFPEPTTTEVAVCEQVITAELLARP